jgi:hypothetical protein
MATAVPIKGQGHMENGRQNREEREGDIWKMAMRMPTEG